MVNWVHKYDKDSKEVSKVDSFILVPLICAVIYGTLTVAALTRFSRARCIFALYLFSAALWSMGSAMTHYGLGDTETCFWGRMIITAGTPMMIFYYHFVRKFTRQKIDVWTFVGYAAALVTVILSSAGVFLKGAFNVDGELFMYYVPYVEVGFILFAFTYLVAAAVSLIRYYRQSMNPLERQRALYLMMGISAFALFSLFELIPSSIDYPLAYAGGAINALLITYAVLKYQLLDIRVVLKKGLVYSGLTVFLSTVYLMILYSVQLFFQNRLGYTSLALAAVIAMMTAILFSPLRDALQKVIDKVFYHNTYDYRQVLLSFSNKINNVLDLDELQQTILQPIVETMHVRQAALMFPEVGTGDFNTRYVRSSDSEELLSKLRLSGDNPVVNWLGEKGEVLRMHLIDILPQFKGMWEVEKTALEALGVEILCPVISKGKLIGILALSGKQSNMAYTDDEASLLKTMANEAAVALENARMLDSVKSQQLQVEQLLGQVVVAQEEERNRISIDLHDSVAQWLVAVSYGIQTFRHDLPDKEVDKARGELSVMEKTITKSLKELRRVVVGLRPPALDELGLTHSIRQSLEELKADNVETEYRQTGKPYRLPSSIEIAIYRVVQESINNIRKHAAASRVKLNIEFREEGITVEVSDNGHGFNCSKTLNSAIAVGHLGLLGMKQRVEMIGGSMDIRTAEGAGAVLTFHFPVLVHVEEK
jgi:signal transduction histidine kinase